MKEQIACLLEEMGQGHHRNIDLSLDRLWPLLEKLDNPHKKLPPVIHIAGTNGKGSTSLFLHRLLSGLGKKVVAYTSPHLVDFNERILNTAAQPIDDDALLEGLLAAKNAAKDLPFTFFELTTVAAFLIFSKMDADFVILECGLGGRLDATNVIKEPALTILTRIDFDHQEYLGNTIDEIIQEKVGIAKPSTSMVVGFQHKPNFPLIKERLADRSSQNIFVDENVEIITSNDENSWNCKTLQQNYRLPFPYLDGRHQLDNAATAIIAVQQLILENYAGLARQEISSEIIATTLTTTFLPARLQKLPLSHPFDILKNKGWIIILDGGHNENAANAIARFIRHKQKIHEPSLACHVILGMLASKNVSSFLRPIEALANSIHTLTIPGSDDCYTARNLSEIALADGINTRPAASLIQAIERISQKKPGILMICGSLYLAGYILKEMGIKPYEKTQ